MPTHLSVIMSQTMRSGSLCTMSMPPAARPPKERGKFMFGKTMMAFILAGVFIAMPRGNVRAAATLPVQGVWTCTAVRAGTIERPLMFTFNSDGTFNYSSATTINSIIAGPVQNSGFHSRGGGRGQWTRISNNMYNYQSVEFLYDANGNLAGSFEVNSNVLITSAGQLCSGLPECPNQNTAISLVKYVFDQDNVDADIVGVDYLLPLNTPANILCNSLSSGEGFPGMPIPMP